MGYLKGKSTMMLFERHAESIYKLGNRNFVSTGYSVSTVGLNVATIISINKISKMKPVDTIYNRK